MGGASDEAGGPPRARLTTAEEAATWPSAKPTRPGRPPSRVPVGRVTFCRPTSRDAALHTHLRPLVVAPLGQAAKVRRAKDQPPSPPGRRARRSRSATARARSRASSPTTRRSRSTRPCSRRSTVSRPSSPLAPRYDRASAGPRAQRSHRLARVERAPSPQSACCGALACRACSGRLRASRSSRRRTTGAAACSSVTSSLSA